MGLKKDIEELVEQNVISAEIGDQIRTYYNEKEKESGNRLFIVFGILGAILIGMGMILIIAHNWDNLSREIKTFVSFLPLVVSQALCLFVLLKKKESRTWKEIAGTLLFFSVSASISLISQVYNIDGNLSSFMLTWMLLSLPIIYLLNSSIVTYLYLLGITTYGCDVGYFTPNDTKVIYYWLLLIALGPHYFISIKTRMSSNFTSFIHWLISISIVICLGTLAGKVDELMVVSYMSLFGLFYLIGSTRPFNEIRVISNSYLILGALGTISMLLFLSFNDFWNDLTLQDFQPLNRLFGKELFVTLLLTIGAGYISYKDWKLSGFKLDPLMNMYIAFPAIFIIGIFTPFSMVLINLITLISGIILIRKGSSSNHLGLVNFGLLVVTSLIICRFFDHDLSFVSRGLMFVIVGIGFFVSNYLILKRKKA